MIDWRANTGITRKKRSGSRRLFAEYGSRKILDVSCGTGSHLARLLDIPEDKQFFGMDASKEMVRLAREKLGRRKVGKVSIARADFIHPPFRDATFDAVLCMYWSLAGLNERARERSFSCSALYSEKRRDVCV